MSKSKSSSTTNSSFPPTQYVILAGITWAVAALLFYLLFNAPTEQIAKDTFVRPGWYRIGTYIFQTVAIAASGFLCLRNWRSSKIMSGGNVWLGLGIGVISWGIGNLIFGYLDFEYQTKLAQGVKNLTEPFPSIADLFFTITYAFLSWGMAMSVIGKRLNLFTKQWAIVGAVGLFGLLVSGYVTFIAGSEGKPVEFNLGKILNTIYALGDVWLLIVAAILLLAFWGGKFAQSWRLLGAAGVAMFIGDLGFNWASKTQNYQSGDWIEVFWILAFVLFGMGAALEFDLSSRARERRK